jgi:heme exporter protein D
MENKVENILIMEPITVIVFSAIGCIYLIIALAKAESIVFKKRNEHMEKVRKRKGRKAKIKRGRRLGRVN